MFEIEMKFRVEDFDQVTQQLQRWQVNEQAPIEETDHYFNAPDRDFGRTDEAFRLRCIGLENRITYKGPKEKGPTKTRTEIELALEAGTPTAEKFRLLVTSLGYRPTAVVRKRRAAYGFEREGFALEVCCDEVEQLGSFVEVEIVTEQADKDRAQALLQKVAGELGLQSSERRSYLEMVLERQGS